MIFLPFFFLFEERHQNEIYLSWIFFPHPAQKMGPLQKRGSLQNMDPLLKTSTPQMMGTKKEGSPNKEEIPAKREPKNRRIPSKDGIQDGYLANMGLWQKEFQIRMDSLYFTQLHMQR